MSPGPKVMSSPPTPVKLHLPVRPKRMALGECRCGGITSLASLSRYAVYIVLTVARRGVHRDQFGGPKQDRLDIVLVAPPMRHGLLRAHQLLDLIMGDVGRSRPEGEHALCGNIAVERFERCLAVGKATRGGR